MLKRSCACFECETLMSHFYSSPSCTPVLISLVCELSFNLKPPSGRTSLQSQTRGPSPSQKSCCSETQPPLPDCTQSSPDAPSAVTFEVRRLPHPQIILIRCHRAVGHE